MNEMPQSVYAQKEDVNEEIIPPQYIGMSAEAVDIAWTIPEYLDPEKNYQEQERKRLALQYLQAQENNVDTTIPDSSSEEIISENAHETESGLEQYLQQPNVVGAKEKINQLLQTPAAFDYQQAKDAIYTLLTKRSWLYEEQQRRGTEDLSWMLEEYKPHREWYKNTIERLDSDFTTHNVTTASNPAWFSITASERQPGHAEQARYKVYDSLNIHDYATIAELPRLVALLQDIGVETGESIKIKIPGNFIGFMTHNDSIVVHCDSAETCQKSKQVIETWKSELGLQPTERELDRATIAMDGKTEASGGKMESFSQLVASQIATWIEKHKGSYPADILASEAMKHAISLAQKTPVIKE